MGLIGSYTATRSPLHNITTQSLEIADPASTTRVGSFSIRAKSCTNKPQGYVGQCATISRSQSLRVTRHLQVQTE